MAQYLEHPRRKSRSWWLLVVGGLIMTFAGFVLGNRYAGPLCGSPFRPDMDSTWMLEGMPDLAFSTAISCNARLEQQTTTTWFLILAGLAIALVGVVVRAIVSSQPRIVVVSSESSTSTPQTLAPMAGSTTYKPPSLVKTPQSLAVTVRTWNAAGIIAIVVSCLGLLLAVAVILPDAVNRYNIAMQDVVILFASTGNLVSGVLVLARQKQRRRGAPISLMASSFVVAMTFLLASSFNLISIVVFVLPAAVAVTVMARALVLDSREKQQQYGGPTMYSRPGR